ncbi:MAG: hypothetical protein PHU63_00405 [Candidatus ainarchaeum sp.]|nr:hypothetical protein [Candidatus ainarchaeum sp.]
MDEKSKTAVGLIVLMIMFLALFSVPKILEENVSTVCIVEGECQHEKDYQTIVNLIPFVAGIGFLLGIIIFYLFYQRNEKKIVKRDPKIILEMFGNEEKKILTRLIEKKGEILQTEISRIEGIGKVKAYRIIKKLNKRGIIEVESFGKTNLIKLKKEIVKEFLGE